MPHVCTDFCRSLFCRFREPRKQVPLDLASVTCDASVVVVGLVLASRVSLLMQGYASDTFALALATVHLFTGDSPYEEIMAEVGR